MTTFVVLGHDEDSKAKAAEKTVFVRDVFAVLALAFPIPWLLWHRLWFHAAMMFLILLGVGGSLQGSVYIAALMPLNLLISFFVALEGPNWRIQAFKRQGYVFQGCVQAETLEDAQLIWAVEGERSEKLAARNVAMQPFAGRPRPAAENDLLLGDGGVA